MELRVRSVEATMNMRGVIEMLPRKAPAAAMMILAAMSFLAPNLSEIIPLGTENRNWRRLGMATMSPICWLVRLNSTLRRGKRVSRMFPAAWTRVWVRIMMRRLEFMSRPSPDFWFSPMLITE